MRLASVPPSVFDSLTPVTSPALAEHIRRQTIEQAKRANVGHIGSALSIADVLAVLYERVLRVPTVDDPDRDRFILSKGHAALALYAALHGTGRLTTEQLGSYCTNGSVLGAHPEHRVAGIDFSTGSLGQGLSVGAGAALAARLQGSSRRVFVLVSDAECNEGALWEAVMFAAHHRLSNLVAIVDDNGQQALGHTRDVLDLTPLAERWASFGWDVVEVDGHDHEALARAFDADGDAPRVAIAKTTFGKGVSYMEGEIKWHYWPMSDAEYSQAVAELEAR
jgi:transketolase